MSQKIQFNLTGILASYSERENAEKMMRKLRWPQIFGPYMGLCVRWSLLPCYFQVHEDLFYNNQRTCLLVRPSVPSFFFNSFPFNAASPHHPRTSPDHPRTFPNHPRMSQNGPISPKNIPSSPQNTPECSQITPRPPQNCHWSHAKRPKITPKCSR